MNDERRRVLELLAEGTIDADQADALLAALESAAEPAPFPQAARPTMGPTTAGTRERGRERARSGPSHTIREASLHGVTPDYVRAMHEIGYNHLSLKDLIQLRIHGVDAEFVEQMGAHNYTAQELVDLRITGVTPEYITEMQSLGYGTETAESPGAQRAAHGGHASDTGEDR